MSACERRALDFFLGCWLGIGISVKVEGRSLRRWMRFSQRRRRSRWAWIRARRGVVIVVVSVVLVVIERGET